MIQRGDLCDVHKSPRWLLCKEKMLERENWGEGATPKEK